MAESVQSRYAKNELPLKTLDKLYLNARTADISFRVTSKDKEVELVPAHKSILSAASSVFDAMFYGPIGGSATFNVVDIDPMAFKEFLQIFYCTEPTFGVEHLNDVIKLAKQYVSHDWSPNHFDDENNELDAKPKQENDSNEPPTQQPEVDASDESDPFYPPEKVRKSVTVFTSDRLQLLEKIYFKNEYPPGTNVKMIDMTKTGDKALVFSCKIITHQRIMNAIRFSVPIQIEPNIKYAIFFEFPNFAEIPALPPVMYQKNPTVFTDFEYSVKFLDYVELIHGQNLRETPNIIELELVAALYFHTTKRTVLASIKAFENMYRMREFEVYRDEFDFDGFLSNVD